MSLFMLAKPFYFNQLLETQESQAMTSQALREARAVWKPWYPGEIDGLCLWKIPEIWQ